MINLANLKFDIKSIDSRWTFAHYLGIDYEQFNGRTIKLKSIFNENEKHASFCLYFKNNVYKFKDFSSGLQGSHVEMVKLIESKRHGIEITRGEACSIIISDYNKWVMEGKKNKTVLIDEGMRFQVSAYNARKWNTNDKKYWTTFHLNSKILEWGLVKPLSQYEMSNIETGFTIEEEYIYGYFNREDKLTKVYQPKNPRQKFINVLPYVAGSEHNQGYDYLLLTSSWKDALCTKILKIKVDFGVPNSENCLLPEEYIEQSKKKYKRIITLFDNDSAGIKAMKNYKKNYNFDYVYLPLEKDISDSIKKHGIKYVKERIIPAIDKVINKL